VVAGKSLQTKGEGPGPFVKKFTGPIEGLDPVGIGCGVPVVRGGYFFRERR
jgi:hypothetical protein